MLNSTSYLKPLLDPSLSPLAFTGLDLGLGDFIAEREQQVGEQHARQMGLLAAILSQQLSAQHVCVQLDELVRLYNLCVPVLAEPLPMLFTSQLQELLEEAVTLGKVEQGISQQALPLILDGQALYLQRYWHYEVTLAEQLKQLASGQFSFDLTSGKQLLAQLFSEETQGTDWQKLAVILAASKQFCVITGGPGTGKTTTVTRLMALIQGLCEQAGQRPLRIVLAAPTGKAAARLSESITLAKARLPQNLRQHLPNEAATLHRLLGYQVGKSTFRHHQDNPLSLDMLILDEASMVDLPMMAKLLAAMPAHARLVMLGDRQQLASVEVGSVLGDICQSLPEGLWQAEQGQYDANTTSMLNQLGEVNLLAADAALSLVQNNLVMLRKSHRFTAGSGVGQLARAINNGQTGAVFNCLQDPALTDVSWFNRADTAQVVDLICRLLQDYMSAVAEKNIQAAFTALMNQQLLCATRRGPWGVEQFNARIELELTRRGMIKPIQELYPGCPLMVSQNDYQVRVFNGDIGICMPDQDGLLKVWFMQADSSVRALLPSRLPAWQKLYAMTIHKSQGSEFEHAIICLPQGQSSLISRELLYTGITRAKQQVSVFADEANVKAAVTAHCQRGSRLAARLSVNG
ncbi:exodeoxyribonuclease V subunit alpha [Bowmanella yangjiangensis]|uniref:RecBCD enzyme subunit RecD n=1 Tax=Bowmanella yangjiangensis TaxID=2811230 RepID=A0ABS3CS43_9ALTE|nr:exodeoxyribonuclease V subunit alpha [Bowmanella yangjiangensis]MBN7819951.1 exodeoxyribonuclease V subunit alpha [Bowmanella yangjiangensis]